MRILDLLDTDPNNPEIQRLSKLLSKVDPETEKPRKPRTRKTHYFVDPEKYIQLRKQGMSMEATAEHFGTTYQVLKCEVVVMMQKGIIPKGAIPRGTGNLKNRMTKKEYLEKKTSGISDEEIAKQLGLSKTSFTRKRKEWGIEGRTRKHINKITLEEYRQMKYDLLTDYQIATKIGVCANTLKNYKRKWGI